MYGPVPHGPRTLRVPVGAAAPVLDPWVPAGPGQGELRAGRCPARWGGHRSFRAGGVGSGRVGLGEFCGVAVAGGVVGDAGVPAAVDHRDPGAGQHAHGVGVVVTAGHGVGVDLRGPCAGVATVVGEGRDGHPKPSVAGSWPRKNRGGCVMRAPHGRPCLAITPALAESQQRAPCRCPQGGSTSDRAERRLVAGDVLTATRPRQHRPEVARHILVRVASLDRREERGLDQPVLADPPGFDGPEPEGVALAGLP